METQMNMNCRIARQPKILVQDVSKIFQGSGNDSVKALDSINLTIYEGEFLCIVGPSGCGKTTLLRILAELEKQTEGMVAISSKDSSKPSTAMVFQEQSVFPWMTVIDNAAYGLRMRGVDKRKAREEAEKYIELIGLKRFAKSFPHQLSGGMKQRVSVARAFAVDPEILLMDEPFGALDEQNRLILQQELLRIWEGTCKTAVFITHSIDEALTLGDRVLVMSARPGKVKAMLDVDIPRPRLTAEIRNNPEFHRYYMEIWSHLQEEVLQATNS